MMRCEQSGRAGPPLVKHAGAMCAPKGPASTHSFAASVDVSSMVSMKRWLRTSVIGGVQSGATEFGGMRTGRQTARDDVPMRHISEIGSRILTCTLLGAVLIVGACGGDDEGSGYSVLAPDAEVDGKDATELLVDYGKILFEVPAAESSLVDPALCDQGMSTDEVYFAQSFGAPGESTSSCTMKKEQVLFLSPIGLSCVEAAGENTDMACIEEGWDLTSSSVTINGVAVEGLTDRQYDTPVIEITLPADNLFEVDPQTTKMIQRGQVVLVEDLPVGEHTVVLGGNFGDGEFAGQITITLTVE